MLLTSNRTKCAHLSLCLPSFFNVNLLEAYRTAMFMMIFSMGHSEI